MRDYQSISVRDAIENIAKRQYLLPAIQRKFVWSMEQIEMLFDSVLRGYPINSFMLWKITNPKNRKEYKFYEFIQRYVQKFNEDNPDAPSRFLKDDFYAVIDGQQRMTSLYIGLGGSYKIKKPNKWWGDDEHKTPMSEKKLYLELTTELESTIDNEKEYNFVFMSDDELKNEQEKDPSKYWFCMHEAIDFNNNNDVVSYLINNNLITNTFAVETLSNLFNRLCVEKIINYYVIDDQDQDKVLEIFIRTNSGGTPLSFSDLLMSIASANWTQYNARDEMKQIKEIIYGYGNPNFNVSQDFILKSLLVLSDVDVRFKIGNFGKRNIEVFEDKWQDIKKSLEATFHLLEELNFNDTLLRAKNAAIPIAYYIYKNGLADEIVKTTFDKENKQKISKWLSMSLLKGIFGGTSDSILKSIRSVIAKHIGEQFPLEAIVEAFKSNPDKNYTFTDDIIEPFLYEQYGSSVCGVVLNLLYPDVVLQHGKSVAQDHMHPKSVFEDSAKINELNLTDEQKAFYKNENNYNSCLNLQLLETLENTSKLDRPLKEWAEENNKTAKDLYISDGVSLDILCFENFIESRKVNLLIKLKEVLGIN